MKIWLRLILAFLLIISLLTAVITSFVLLFFYTITEYKNLSDNLILENTFTETVPELIENYYRVVFAPGSTERYALYKEQRDSILDTISRLDKTIVYDQSKISYTGLKNTIIDIIGKCDSGIEEIRKGNLTAAASYYNDMLLKKFFVIENTASLMVKELKYVEIIQKNVDNTYNIIIIMISVLTLVVILSCIIFAILFSEKMTVPIIRLSKIANDVAEGRMKRGIDNNLLNRKDEIGSLSRSLNVMIKKIETKITELEDANVIASNAKKAVEDANSELEKINKLAIGRELKMIELKNKLKNISKKPEQ
ncbi:MAG: HAMP domain-containing protein [Candidatus Aenigmarchaeota archaeon]|nr:HAMP domain-containing protein [Candidatus Aenigmarchaeota archaeon]